MHYQGNVGWTVHVWVQNGWYTFETTNTLKCNKNFVRKYILFTQYKENININPDQLSCSHNSMIKHICSVEESQMKSVYST